MQQTFPGSVDPVIQQVYQGAQTPSMQQGFQPYQGMLNPVSTHVFQGAQTPSFQPLLQTSQGMMNPSPYQMLQGGHVPTFQQGQQFASGGQNPQPAIQLTQEALDLMNQRMGTQGVNFPVGGQNPPSRRATSSMAGQNPAGAQFLQGGINPPDMKIQTQPENSFPTFSSILGGQGPRSQGFPSQAPWSENPREMEERIVARLTNVIQGTKSPEENPRPPSGAEGSEYSIPASNFSLGRGGRRGSGGFTPTRLGVPCTIPVPRAWVGAHESDIFMVAEATRLNVGEQKVVLGQYPVYDSHFFGCKPAFMVNVYEKHLHIRGYLNTLIEKNGGFRGPLKLAVEGVDSGFSKCVMDPGQGFINPDDVGKFSMRA